MMNGGGRDVSSDSEARRRERFERLIKNGATVAKYSDAVMRTVGMREDSAARLVDELDGMNLLRIVLGTRGASGRAPKRRLVAFWHSVRAAVYAQFSGFALDSENSREALLDEMLVEKGGLAALSPEYWQAARTGAPSLDRAFVLLSLHAAVLATVSGLGGRTPTRERGILEALRRMERADVNELVRTMGQYVCGGIEKTLKEHGLREHAVERQALEQHTAEKFDALSEAIEVERLMLTVSRLESRVAETRSGRSGRAPKIGDEELIDGLRRLVPRGQESSNPFSISALLHSLAGRYLRPEFKPLPEWRQLIAEAIQWVLKEQEPEGAWRESRVAARPDVAPDARIRAYVPLVRLLDLPNELLVPQVEGLLTAAERAIGEVMKELERLQIRLAVGDGRVEEMSDDVWRAVGLAAYQGFMAGTVVADRFKDLLSDSILEDLGAEDPDPGVEWETVPDSLKFKRNIEEGVVRLWRGRSERRPGAILLYGPPGTGKTTIAKVIARKLNQELGSSPSEGGRDRKWRFLEFTPADFARSGTDRVVASAERIFSQLRQVRRCVVLLDEMEEFLRTRGSESDRDSRLVTTAFLPLLQEAVRSREIILVVATNFVGAIDPAVTRRGRFDLILPLGPPDGESRLRILRDLDGYAELSQGLAEDAGVAKAEVDDLVARYTMGYSGPEIADFVEELGRLRHGRREAGDRARVVMDLWRIRQERVPTALSGRTGSNWRAFRDEARRYARYADVMEGDRSVGRSRGGAHEEDGEYWREPALPTWEERGTVERQEPARPRGDDVKQRRRPRGRPSG